VAFDIPSDLHPSVVPLAWLLGTWRGRGHGEYEGMDRFEFAQEVVFSHDTRNFLTYYSRSWLLDEAGEITTAAGVETGFWRVENEGVLEVLLANGMGQAQGWVGRFEGPRIQLALDHNYASPTGQSIEQGHRLYGLVDGELFWAYDLAAEGAEMQPHIWATLQRA
jgi:hypothetical protein